MFSHEWFFTIVIPYDTRLNSKLIEKIEKYQDLGRELRKLWNYKGKIYRSTRNTQKGKRRIDDSGVRVRISSCNHVLDNFEWAIGHIFCKSSSITEKLICTIFKFGYSRSTTLQSLKRKSPEEWENQKTCRRQGEKTWLDI